MSFVYKFVNFKNEIIYIGKTNNLEKRMKQHFNGEGHLPTECYKQVSRIFFIIVDGKTNVDMYETFLINKYIPKYNVEKRFQERLSLHHNSFINVEEIEWTELFFRFNQKGIELSKKVFHYEFFNRNISDVEKCLCLLNYNYFQLINRQGLYEHYLNKIMKDTNDFLEYLIYLHQEIIENRNFSTTYSYFDEPISIENNSFEYVAIDINKLNNINLQFLFIMVQSKMLVRISNNLYGIVAHTPYALKKFNQIYYYNEYEN